MLFRLKREVIWSLLQHGRILRMKVKIRQSQKTDTVWFHLKQVSGVTKFIETQTKNMVARNEDEGKWGVVYGAEFQFCKMKSVLDTSCTTGLMFLAISNYTL